MNRPFDELMVWPCHELVMWQVDWQPIKGQRLDFLSIFLPMLAYCKNQRLYVWHCCPRYIACRPICLYTWNNCLYWLWLGPDFFAADRF